MSADKIVEAETARRIKVRRAVYEMINRKPDAVLYIDDLRSHLRRYYGSDLADGATAAELSAAIAEMGGFPTGGLWLDVELRQPSRTELRRIAAEWNAKLPPAEIPLIRRAMPGTSTGGILSPEDILPAGMLYQVCGVHKQAQDGTSLNVWRDGGDNRRSSTARKRRFPGYIERIRALLDGSSVISAIDRQIFEHVTEGKTLQWIADEMGMKKATVHKRVAAARKRAGIAGPGAGR